MKLRIYFTLNILVSLLVSAIALNLLIAGLMATTFKDLESEMATKDLDRLLAGFTDKQRQLDITCRDYAQWDATWDYLRYGSTPFLEVDFTEEGFRKMGVSIAGLADFRDSTVYAWRADAPGLGTEELVIPGRSGLFELHETLYLVSVIFATRNDGTGEGLARVLLGFRLDPLLISDVSNEAQVHGGIVHDTDPLAYAQWNGRIPAGSRAVFEEPDGRYFRGLASLPLINESNSLLVWSKTYCYLSAELPKMVMLFNIVSVLAAMALTGLIWRRLGDTVTRPIEQLSSTLSLANFNSESIAGTETLRSLSGHGGEIGCISKVALELFSRLQSSRNELLEANKSLELMVNERTTSLRLANSQLQFYAHLLRDSSEGIMIMSLDGQFVEVNEALCRITGYSRDDLLKVNLFAMRLDPVNREILAGIKNQLLSENRWSGELVMRRKNGETFYIWLSLTALFDENGEKENYVGLSSDISRIKTAEEQLKQMAHFDSLTGLPNRALFLDRLNGAIIRAKREGTQLALLYLDLDRFKIVNDSLGHSAGDNLLVQVSGMLLGLVRHVDTVSRLGGDEFTIILENVRSSQNVAEICDKIVGTISQPILVNEEEVCIGASIGISFYPNDALQSNDLIQVADEAMYKAKEEGRGSWRFGSGDTHAHTKRRLEIASNLRHAVDRQELFLQYQPQVSASSKELLGAEVLLRWKHGPDMLLPGNFIDIAEESDLICQIGNWVLLNTCKEAKRFSLAGRPIVMSVNTSVRQYQKGDLPQWVAYALDESGLDPSLLKLEITESMFMKDINSLVATMNEIRKLGVQFAVDDFGVGFSCLQYLTRLPLSTLKIDKSFVDGLSLGRESTALVGALISMAKALGLSLIAEGVETEEQMRKLQILGCDTIQGYLTGKPVSSEELFAKSAG